MAKQKRLSPEETELACAMRRAYDPETGVAVYTLLDIAVELDVSTIAIYHRTKHIPPPPGGWQKPQRRELDRGKAKRLIGQGLSYRAVGERLGVSQTAIYRAVNT